ncbi:type VI secretion system baseplate subunit TssF [Trinickia sp.]|uniref:type VI secretion system baseplate subunit TssF n=1 Tax=Trinickia sp. TaxID=2571163 RepID=UPI003F814845
MTAGSDDLLPEYERELARLRRSLHEFAQRHPEAAARLSISGEQSEDPHVERLIQSAALQFARASARIEDNYPELPTAILENFHPEYLRPFPSCSIAQFEGSAGLGKLTKPVTLQRGTELKTRKGEYPFVTVYDVVLAPLRIADARYAPATSAPAKIRLNENTTGILSITFSSIETKPLLEGSMPKRVRLFVDGGRRTVAATIDTFLLRASTAFVEAEASGTWIALDAVPLSAPGFDLDEALIERRDDNPSQFRLLLEYFSFPQKFDFIDIDLSALTRAAGPCSRVTLHLPIQDVHRDSRRGQRLEALTASNFKLFCTPVINLFASPAEPIASEDMALPVFPVVPGTLGASAASVYRIDDVQLMQEGTKGAVFKKIERYQSLYRHTAPQDSGVFWMAERDGRLAEFLPGQDMVLSLVDAAGRITDVVGKQIDMDLACTNGNLPASLEVGDPRGDFSEGNEALAGRASLLFSPTESVERPKTPTALWDMIAMLSAGALNISQAGLPAFKQLLAAHAPSRSPGARHIEGLKHLARESALEWIVMEPQPTLVRGLRIRLGVSETILDDCTVSALGRVLESLFVHYAPANSFMQLVLMSAENWAELFKGRPLPGAEFEL